MDAYGFGGSLAKSAFLVVMVAEKCGVLNGEHYNKSRGI